MRVITSPTPEDKNQPKAFDPDQPVLCPKCGSHLLRERTGGKDVYLKCKDCGKKYKAERFKLVERPIIKIYTASTGDFDWLVNIMKPAAEAVRKAIKEAMADRDCTLGMREELSVLLDKTDADMAWDILHFQDDTEWINDPMMSQRQNEIRDIVNKALDKVLNLENKQKIMRFVFYAVSLRDNALYNNVLRAWEQKQDAISMDLRPVSAKRLRNKQKGK